MSLGGVLGGVGSRLLHLGGTALQFFGAGGAVLFHLDPRIGVVAWAVGKALEVFGVRVALPDVPPKS